MKKMFLVVIVAFLAFNLSAQNNDKIELVKILSAGSAEITNGICTIKMDISSDNYYVNITPVGEYSQLYISTKDTNSFTVKSANSQNAKFEYVIIEKKTKYRLSDTETKKSNTK